MAEKCPCQTDIQSCCACVSMKCHECFKPNHSKFVQGRFCSNCGRALKADVAQTLMPKTDFAKALNEVELLIIITKEMYHQQMNNAPNAISAQNKRTKWIAFEKFYEQFAELKKKYTEDQHDEQKN